MLTGTRPIVREARAAYRPFRVTVAAVTPLAPSFTRVTFHGPDLDLFGTDRLDQRVKILFPVDAEPLPDLDDPAIIDDGSWFAVLRGLPAESRPAFRTYTVRDVRPEHFQVDVDFVAHGDHGPAARWLLDAKPGDEVLLVGPDARSLDSQVGIDWHPGTAGRVLLVGDETAAPAICAILEGCDRELHVDAFIEVPTGGDVLPVDSRHADAIRWLPRGDRSHGELLRETVTRWLDTHRDAYAAAIARGRRPGADPGADDQALADIDLDLEVLWDSPLDAERGCYAWIAGEAGTVKLLRRHLVSDIGFDRTAVAFMGYWRLGRAEPQE